MFMAVKISRALISLDNNKDFSMPKEIAEAADEYSGEFEAELLKQDKIIAFTLEYFNNSGSKKVKNYFFENTESAIAFLLTILSERNYIESHLSHLKFQLDNDVRIEWTVDFNYPL